MNVDTLPAVESQIQAQKSLMREAAAGHGERPLVGLSRGQLLDEHAMRLSLSQALAAGVDVGRREAHARTMVIAERYPPSVVPYESLAKIALKELRLETHHRGHYLLVRTIAEPARLISIGTVVEDEHGDVATLQLYHQLRPDAPHETPGTAVPAGSVCVIKEPFLEVTAEGKVGVRVDHVSDVVWLAEDDEYVPEAWRSAQRDKSAGEWRQKGNEAYAAGNYRRAITYYTIALRHCATENEKPALHQNRAIANLRLDIFDAALADASRSSLEAELPEKAQYRAAMALYGLSRYDECRERLEALLNRYPDNPAAREKLLAVEQRLREQQTGEYDFKAMQEQVRAGRRHLDIATYSKPVIVKEAPGKGRGLFTTEAVKAGTLLLCEKAFAYGAAADDESGGVLITAGSGSISLLMNKPTKDVIAGMQPAVISSVVQKMFRNPSLAPTITDLDCGSYEPVKDAGLVDGQLVVDSFLVERVVALDAFGCPPSSLGYHFAPRATAAAAADESVLPRSSSSAGAARFHSVGVWPLAARLNHSCVYNTERSFIGDALVLRAARDLPADAELTTAYRANDGSGAGQAALDAELRRRWGFTCACPLCADVRATRSALLATRDAMTREILGFLGEHINSPDRMEVVRKKIDRLADTYATTSTTTTTTTTAVAAAGGTGSGSGSGGGGSGGEAAAPHPSVVPRLPIALAQTEFAAAWLDLAKSAGARVQRLKGVFGGLALTAALEALQARGFVMRSRIIDPEDSSGSARAGGAARGERQARAAAAEAVRDESEPWLEVDEWGLVGSGAAFDMWFVLAKVATLLNLPAGLAEAATRHARTAYTMLVGEDTTFDEVWARVMA